MKVAVFSDFRALFKKILSGLRQIPDQVVHGWRRSFDYKGRSTRKELWGFLIGNHIFLGAVFIQAFKFLAYLMAFVSVGLIAALKYLIIAFLLGSLLATASLVFRRLRDCGINTSWLALPIFAYLRRHSFRLAA